VISFPYSIRPSDQPQGSGRVLEAGNTVSFSNRRSAGPHAQTAIDRFHATGRQSGVIVIEAHEIEADNARVAA
jgi:hypothetical protein